MVVVSPRRRLVIGPAELIPPARPHFEIHAVNLRDVSRPTIVVVTEELDSWQRPQLRSIYLAPYEPEAVALGGTAVPPVIDEVTAYFFRGDTRPPSQIFTAGFKCRGNDEDIRHHVSSSFNSVFIPTSRKRSVALSFARQGYLYLIRNDAQSGIDLNATFNTHGHVNHWWSEDEVAFYREIPSCQVLLARCVQSGEVVANPQALKLEDEAWRWI